MGDEARTAEEVRRLRRTIITIAVLVAVAAWVIVAWVSSENSKASVDREVDEYLECVYSGRGGC